MSFPIVRFLLLLLRRLVRVLVWFAHVGMYGMSVCVCACSSSGRSGWVHSIDVYV